MIQGLDYSAGPIPGSVILANGYSFVCRYVSTPGRRKNLTLPEVNDLRAAGVAICVVYEDAVGDALEGFNGGAARARSADASVNALGLGGIPIFLAVDFDVQPNQYPVVDDYLNGGASVLGHDRLGVYGKNAYLTHVLDGGIVRYAWAAPAWGGSLDPRAHLFQSGGGTVNGVGVDFNRTVSSDTDYGQFGSTPAPQPVSTTPTAGYLARLLARST